MSQPEIQPQPSIKPKEREAAPLEPWDKPELAALDVPGGTEIGGFAISDGVASADS